jgi:transcriptional regulator with XRE-family HTH domain
MAKVTDWVLDQARVRELLEKRFRGQRAAAAAMGVDQSRLNRTLNGSPNVTLTVAGRICDALGVPFQDILIRRAAIRPLNKQKFRGPGAPERSGNRTVAVTAGAGGGGKPRRPKRAV